MDDKKKKQAVQRNFIESLKDLSGNMIKTTRHDLVGGIVKTAGQQLFGLGSFNDPAEFGQAPMNQIENKEKFQWSNQEITSLRVQERMIFKQAEEEVRLQIEAIRLELIKLIKEAQKISEEVKVAAVQAPVEPGIYHVSFFEQLRNLIIFLRKNVCESRNWLATCNSRAKKRNFYWGQVKKSGTKFMLSQERYMSTQAG